MSDYVVHTQDNDVYKTLRSYCNEAELMVNSGTGLYRLANDKEIMHHERYCGQNGLSVPLWSTDI